MTTKILQGNLWYRFGVHGVFGGLMVGISVYVKFYVTMLGGIISNSIMKKFGDFPYMSF